MAQVEEPRQLLYPDLLALLERLSLAYRELPQDRTGAVGPARPDRQGIDFYEFASYQPGIDIRHVDWSVHARTGSLVVRSYESQQEQPICVLLDCSASMGLGTPPRFELAVRLAGALAYVGLVTYHPVRIVAFSQDELRILPHRQGRESVHEVLKFLGLLQTGGATQLATGVTAGLEGVSRKAGRLFLISDFLDPAGLAPGFGLLATTRRRVDLVAITDDREAELPAGPVEGVDPETGQRLPLVVTPEVAAAYREQLTALRVELRRRAHEIQAHVQFISSATPLEDAILQLLT